MQSINRFLYGPTPEEKIRAWQAKLRAEQRLLDREMRQVSPRREVGHVPSLKSSTDRHCGGESEADSKATGDEGRRQVCTDTCERGGAE